MGSVGTRIAELRRAHRPRLTQAALAERAGLSVDLVAKLEQGRKASASLASLERIADAIGVPLAALLADEPDGLDRLEKALATPRLTDPALIDQLGEELARQRRLEDVFGARHLVRANIEHVRTVQALAKDAGRAERMRLYALAGQWAQFLGWMHNDLADRAGAERWFDRSAEWAQLTGDVDLLASTLSMKSHAAWSARDTGRAVDLAEASLLVPGTASGVRALSAQQAARGHALAGDASPAERRLDQAEALTGDAVSDPDAQPPWIYFHTADRLTMQRALAYTELGRGQEAVALLLHGLDNLDATLKRDRGWYLARLAVAHAVAGDVDEAATAAVAAAESAHRTGSSQTLGDLRRAHTLLHERWPRHRAVTDMDDAIRALAA